MPQPRRTARSRRSDRPGGPSGVPATLGEVYAVHLAGVGAASDGDGGGGDAGDASGATTDVGDERGWLLAQGVVDLIEPFITAMPRDPADLARFAGVSGATADGLLSAMSPLQLADRQNDAPTLGAVLRAAAAHPDAVEVHGYLVGPGRRDERIAAEGVDVYGLPLLDVRPDHDEECQCQLLWEAVVEQLGVDDAVTSPHEITLRINPWRPHEPCWRLWWD